MVIEQVNKAGQDAAQKMTRVSQGAAQRVTKQMTKAGQGMRRHATRQMSRARVGKKLSRSNSAPVQAGLGGGNLYEVEIVHETGKVTVEDSERTTHGKDTKTVHTDVKKGTHKDGVSLEDSLEPVASTSKEGHTNQALSLSDEESTIVTKF